MNIFIGIIKKIFIIFNLFLIFEGNKEKSNNFKNFNLIKNIFNENLMETLLLKEMIILIMLFYLTKI